MEEIESFSDVELFDDEINDEIEEETPNKKRKI